MRPGKAATTSSILAAVVTGLVGLGGALIGGGFTLAGTREAAEADALRQGRDLRRTEYSEYIDALDEYAAAAASRFERCAAGTDEARDADIRCKPLLADYEVLGKAYRSEYNDMELVGSDEALMIKDAIGATLPDVTAGLAVKAVDEEPVQGTFKYLHGLFLEVAACDTSPNPRLTCPAVRDQIRSDHGLMQLVMLMRTPVGDERQQSITPELQEVIMRLRHNMMELQSNLPAPD